MRSPGHAACVVVAGAAWCGCASLAGIGGFYDADGDAGADAGVDVAPADAIGLDAGAANDAPANDAPADAGGGSTEAGTGPSGDGGIAWLGSAFGWNVNPDGGSVSTVTVYLSPPPHPGALLAAVIYFDNYDGPLSASGWIAMGPPVYDQGSRFLTAWMARVADGSETSVTFAAADWTPTKVATAAVAIYAGVSTTAPFAVPGETGSCTTLPWDGSVGCTSPGPLPSVPPGTEALIAFSLDGANVATPGYWFAPPGMTARMNQGGLAIFDAPAGGLVGSVSTTHAATGATASVGLFVLQRP